MMSKALTNLMTLLPMKLILKHANVARNPDQLDHLIKKRLQRLHRLHLQPEILDPGE